MDQIDEAVARLRSGGLVAFPTETVYGLGADARNPQALARLYALKGRPEQHPVIVHLSCLEDLSEWAQTVPEPALRLARRFWPGPLTLIVPRRAEVLDQVTGGQATVGLRVPDHPLALELLRRFGGGLAAPSANRFGRVSPTRAEHVAAEFGLEVDLVLDGGPCRVGLESTILDCSVTPMRVLRPGAITAEQLQAAASNPQGRTAPRAPGTLERHYQPRKPAFRADPLPAPHPGDGRLTWRSPQPGEFSLHLGSDPERYARGLYAALRELDQGPCQRILVETPPPEWEAVTDRVRRATLELGPEPGS